MARASLTKKRLILAVLAGLFSFSCVSNDTQANDVWYLPIPDEERPPISYNISQNPTGIMVDISAEVGRRIGVPIHAKPYPVSKRRSAFLEGKFVIECCLIPLWRSRPEEINNQVFSDPVHETQDIFLFPIKGSFPIKNMSTLENKRVVVIKGYTYKGEQHFGQRLDANNALELLTMLDQGKADIGILQRRVAAYHIRQKGLKVEFGPLQHAVNGRFRLHKSKAAFIPAINRALADMKRDGTLRKIYRRHSGWMQHGAQATN